MGFLDGGAARLFGEILGGVFLPAMIAEKSGAVTFDNQGTLRRGGTPPRTCRVQIDRATERWRDQPGFTSNDVSIIVLATSLEGTVAPGNVVTVDTGPHAGIAYRLAAPIERDPAGAGWVARGVQERAAGG